MRKAFIVVALAAALAAGRPTWPLLASIWEGLSWPNGCESQPGGCGVTTQSDEGLGMDPNGKPGGS